MHNGALPYIQCPGTWVRKEGGQLQHLFRNTFVYWPDKKDADIQALKLPGQEGYEAAVEATASVPCKFCDKQHTIHDKEHFCYGLKTIGRKGPSTAKLRHEDCVLTRYNTAKLR